MLCMGGGRGGKRSVSVWLGVSQLSSSTSTTITTDFRLKPFIPPRKKKQTPKCSLRANIKAIKIIKREEWVIIVCYPRCCQLFIHCSIDDQGFNSAAPLFFYSIWSLKQTHNQITFTSPGVQDRAKRGFSSHWGNNLALQLCLFFFFSKKKKVRQYHIQVMIDTIDWWPWVFHQTATSYCVREVVLCWTVKTAWALSSGYLLTLTPSLRGNMKKKKNRSFVYSGHAWICCCCLTESILHQKHSWQHLSSGHGAFFYFLNESENMKPAM